MPCRWFDANLYIPNLLYCRGANTRKFTRKILPGTQIIAINGMPIDEYVVKWNRGIDNSVRWDSKCQKFYTLRIYLPSTTGLSEDALFTCQYNDSIYVQGMKPSSYMNGCFNSDSWLPSVSYLDKENILFICVPCMDYEEISFYKDNIQKNKDKLIRKVVIDIRNNGGE